MSLSLVEKKEKNNRKKKKKKERKKKKKKEEEEGGKKDIPPSVYTDSPFVSTKFRGNPGSLLLPGSLLVPGSRKCLHSILAGS
jgi:hypothetical protein